MIKIEKKSSMRSIHRSAFMALISLLFVSTLLGSAAFANDLDGVASLFFNGNESFRKLVGFTFKVLTPIYFDTRGESKASKGKGKCTFVIETGYGDPSPLVMNAGETLTWTQTLNGELIGRTQRGRKIAASLDWQEYDGTYTTVSDFFDLCFHGVLATELTARPVSFEPLSPAQGPGIPGVQDEGMPSPRFDNGDPIEPQDKSPQQAAAVAL